MLSVEELKAKARQRLEAQTQTQATGQGAAQTQTQTDSRRAALKEKARARIAEDPNAVASVTNPAFGSPRTTQPSYRLSPEESIAFDPIMSAAKTTRSKLGLSSTGGLPALGSTAQPKPADTPAASGTADTAPTLNTGLEWKPAQAPTAEKPDSYYSLPDTEDPEIKSVQQHTASLADSLQRGEQTVRIYEKTLTGLENELTAADAELSSLVAAYEANPTQEDYERLTAAVGRWDRLYAQYNSIYNNFHTQYGKFQTTAGQYSDAATLLNARSARNYNEYRRWKSSIRDEDAILAELEQINADLDHSQRRDEVEANKNTRSDALVSKKAADSEETTSLRQKKALLEEELAYSQFFFWFDAAENADFQEGSRYISSANGKKAEKMGYTDSQGVYREEYIETGFDDLLHDFINRNPEAVHIVTVKDTNSNAALLGLDREKLLRMTDEEVAIYNYWYNQGKDGKEKAQQFLEYLQSTDNQVLSSLSHRQYALDYQEAYDFGKEHPVAAFFMAPIESAAAPVSLIGQAVDYLDDGKIDPYAGYNRPVQMADAMREYGSGQAEKNWGLPGTIAYGLGSSYLDLAATTFAGGGNSWIALGLMASKAAASTTLDAKQRGLSDGQALSLGLATGTVEALTEKIGLDALFGKFGQGKSGFVKYLTNFAAGGGEEVAADVGGFVFDVLISQDKSHWQLRIDELTANGEYTDAEAFAIAFGEQAKDLGISFATGGLMTLPGGIGQAASKARQYITERNASQAAATQSPTAPVGAGALDGPDSPTAPQAHPYEPLNAIDIVDATVSGEAVGPAQTAQEAVEGAVSLAKEKGTVSNTQATRILQTPGAVEYLQETTGITLPGTASGNRAAVKEAVMSLASQPAESSATVGTGLPDGPDTTPAGSAADGVPQTTSDNLSLRGGEADVAIPSDTQQTTLDPARDTAAWLDTIVPKSAQQQSASAGDGTEISENRTKAISNPIETYSTEKQRSIRQYLKAVDEKIKSFVQRVKSGDLSFHREKISDVHDRMASDVKGLLGIDVTGYTNNINTNGIKHTLNRHGENGAQDHSMAVDDDIARVGWVLNNYDDVELLTENGKQVYSTEFLDTDGHPVPQIRFKKRIDGTYYVVEAVFENRYKKGWVQSAYIAKKEDVTQAPTEGQTANHETNARSELTSPSSNDSIPTPEQNVNPEDSAESPNPSVGADTEDGSFFGPNTVGSAESPFEHRTERSKLYTNTYANANGPAIRRAGKMAKKLDPDIDLYDVITEKESLYNAFARLSSAENIEAEYNELISKDAWSAEDNDTAHLLLAKFAKDGNKTSLMALARKQREILTKAGALVQSNAKYTRTAKYSRNIGEAIKNGADAVNELTSDSVPVRFYKKEGFDAWKKSLYDAMTDMIMKVEQAEEGKVVELKNIIRSVARFRKTTGWFGQSNSLTHAAERALWKMDFDTAKTIAFTQISRIPNDFRKRSKGEILKTVRVHNMLTSVPTFGRNVAGNATLSVLDSLSDSTVGWCLDNLVSKATGKRTVGFELRPKIISSYFRGAKSAADMAALCVELDIPMESEGRFEAGRTRTHSPRGNPMTRGLSAFEKYLKYALEVTDKYFEGGAQSSVDASLESLGTKAGLSYDERMAVSQKVANRRTFKDDGQLAEAAKGIREALNKFGKESSPDFGAGDILSPFPGVGSNVTQTGIDYTGAGTLKSVLEVFRVIRDAKQGKTENLAERQRKAVSDAARGVSSIGLVALSTALATCGIITAEEDDEDWDRGFFEKSLGLVGAKMNISAAIRLLKGEPAGEMREDDITIELDFLEPFNTQMYMGYLLAQDEDYSLGNLAEVSLASIMASVTDSPMMQSLSDAVDLIEGLFGAESGEESLYAVSEFAGDTASSYIPAWLRQIAQTVDPYYRDASGDNPAQAAANRLIEDIPFASKLLPKKYGADGRPLTRYDHWAQGVHNNLLSPTEIAFVGDAEFADQLGSLSDRTGNTTIYPERNAPKSFTVDGQTVMVSGKEMTETYQSTYMGHINTLYTDLLSDPVFDALSDDLKVEALENAKQYATEQAKASVSDYALTTWVSEAGEDPAATILNRVAAGVANDATKALSRAWADGKTTTADALVDAWDLCSSFEAEARTALIDQTEGSTQDFLRAMDAGVSPAAFHDLYRTYWALDKDATLSGADKAIQWGVALDRAVKKDSITQEQRDVLWDSMPFYSMFRQEAEKYNDLVDAGLSANKASSLLERIDSIVPKPGNKTVSDIQKFEAIVAFPGLTAKQEDAALREYMDDSQEKKYDDVRDMGLTAQDYIDAYNAIQEESGDGKKLRVIAGFQSDFGLSYADAKALYEIFEPTGK